MGKLDEYFEAQRQANIDAGLRAYERFLNQYSYTHSDELLRAFSTGWSKIGDYRSDQREMNEAGSMWWVLFTISMILAGTFGIVPTVFYLFVPGSNIDPTGLYWTLGSATAALIIAFESARKGRESHAKAKQEFDLRWSKNS